MSFPAAHLPSTSVVMMLPSLLLLSRQRWGQTNGLAPAPQDGSHPLKDLFNLFYEEYIGDPRDLASPPCSHWWSPLLARLCGAPALRA